MWDGGWGRKSVGDEHKGRVKGHILPNSVHAHTYIKEDLWKVKGSHR